MTEIRQQSKRMHARAHWKTRVSPIVLGITPDQIAKMSAETAVFVLRKAAEQIMDVADELEGMRK